ncbi:MAG: hypothetical protein AB4911_24865, partial [Oscillochloridaceae bacterium umkhey_bin13]
MLKLLAQPIEQMHPVGALDGPLGVANGDVLVRCGGQACALLLQKDVGRQHQGSEAEDSCKLRLSSRHFSSLKACTGTVYLDARCGHAGATGGVPATGAIS